MITVIALFVILIFLLLIGMAVLTYFAWKKVEVFLTWNTRYSSNAYEQAVTSASSQAVAPIEQRGRKIKPVPELVDIQSLEFEKGYEAVAEIGKL